jgi:hypothetical protein
MLSCARLVLEVVIWSARTGIDRLTVHRFLNKFHHGQDVNQHQSKVNVGEELQLLGAYDYSLMDRCGANRLDEIQLSMLLACVLSEDSRLLACSDARLARLVSTAELLWCEVRCQQSMLHLADDESLYRRWREQLKT